MNKQDDGQARSSLERILELARWAPSGDNTQPWHFDIIDAHRFNVNGHDTRHWCVYDLDGRASQIALGALLETIAIAATGEGVLPLFERRDGTPETNPVIQVALVPDKSIRPDPLVNSIASRTTQRRALSATPLSADEKQRLEQAVGPGFGLIWIDEWTRKWQMARLLYANAGIRLGIPEAYEVHRRIVEWGARFSTDRIPDQAIGLDRLSLRLMKWAMHSWRRVKIMNRFFAGTMLPRLQLDLIPALRCGAHFVITSKGRLTTIDDYLRGGRAVQRFWLTCDHIGLQFQPELTPLIFSRYARASIAFTVDQRAQQKAAALSARLGELLGQDTVDKAMFMGRVGRGKQPSARSLRKPVDALRG